MGSDKGKTSELFSAPDADVIFRSSDNIQFHLHKKMLECATGGFPPADVSLDTNETTDLTESGKTLELLFQFVYPRPYPSLKGFDLSSLLELAEAAEKYQVFSLMAITQLLLEKFIPQYPKDILQFAAKHDVEDLCSALQPILVETPLSDVAGILSPKLFKCWALYRDNYMIGALRSAQTRSSKKSTYGECGKNSY